MYFLADGCVCAADIGSEGVVLQAPAKNGDVQVCDV